MLGGPELVAMELLNKLCASSRRPARPRTLHLPPGDLPPRDLLPREPRAVLDTLQSQRGSRAFLLERACLRAVLVSPAAVHRLQKLQLTEVEQTRGHPVLGRQIPGQAEVLV